MAARVYTEAELALFAQYREKRAAYRPDRCHMAPDCWVEKGPPSLRPSSGIPRCSSCGDHIRVPQDDR